MLESGLPELVDDSEVVVRFLFQRSGFSAERVKPSAFMPNPNDNKKSVYRIDADPEIVLATHASSPLVEKKLKAAAAVLTIDIRKASLDVASQEPPLRHANIEGWFVDNNDPERTKAKQMEAAIIIADKATLIRYP